MDLQKWTWFGKNEIYNGTTFYDTFFNKKGAPKKNGDAFIDVIDYLNGYWMPALLVFFIGFITTMGPPIDCLETHKITNKLSKDEWEYALDYCSNKNQYYSQPGQPIPQITKRTERQLAYYNWVQLFILLQATVFFALGHFWKYVAASKGIKFDSFMTELNKNKKFPFTNKNVKVAKDKMVCYLRKYFFDERRRNQGSHSARFTGFSLQSLYLAFKLLTVVNCLIQFLLLNAFVQNEVTGLWGMDTLTALYSGQKWQDSHVFPRMSLCDFPIRRLDSVAVIYTIQCHLRINCYNEKIFFTIWLALIILLALNCFAFLRIFVSYFTFWPVNYEKKARELLRDVHLQPILISKKHHHLVKEFAEDVLKKDGILLFTSIQMNFNSAVAQSICSKLFIHFLRKKYQEVFAKITPLEEEHEDDMDLVIVKE